MLHAFRFDTTFHSLRNRQFRWLWVGRLASSATFEMGAVAQGWLVYELTGSAFALSWVSAGWSISTLLLSLFGGVICDRVEKRNLLVWTRAAMGLNTLTIALLVSFGVIQVWHLAVSSLFTGMLFAFLMPAQQSILSDLVDRGTLLNAVALDSIGMGLMGIFGASLAGVLIRSIGVHGVYLANTSLYVIALLTLLRIPKTGLNNTACGSVWADLKAGLGYVIHEPALFALLGLAIVRVLFGMSYRTFMPKFAIDNMGFDSRGLGLLMAGPGLGGLISSLSIASLGDFRNKGRLLLIGGLLLGVGLILFVSTPWVALVLLFLAMVGAANNICMVSNNALLQTHADNRFRGRVLSLYMMTWGLSPLGSLPAGAIVDRFGVPPVVIGQGMMVILLFLTLGWGIKVIRQLE